MAAAGSAFLLFQTETGIGPDLLFTAVYLGLMVMAAASCLWRAAAVRQERVAWTVLGAGLLSWTFGELYWTLAFTNADTVPVPSVADAGYLLYYPAIFVTLVLLFRERVREFRSSHWLDGAIAALAVASLASAIAFRPIVDATTGDAAAIAVNLAYPLGDLLLLSLVVAIFGLSGWRPGRAWLFLGAGLALSAGADGLYLLQSATGAYVEGGLLDAAWPIATLLVGLAAWQPSPRRAKVRLEGGRVIAVPFACGLIAIGLESWDHFERISDPALILATSTLVAVVIRMALVFAENQAMITSSRDEARTDALTGLRNRRSLMGELEAEIERATLEAPAALILFDLDGFKEYNDAFGHPAGDGLLARLGERLQDAVRGVGRAYRLGGDEFCVLAQPGAAGAEAVVAAALSALSDKGEGFEITASHGVALLPQDAQTAENTLQLADRRMYARKGGRRLSAGRQTRDVLLSTLSERQPDLYDHLRDVAGLAIAVSRELELSPEDLDEVARAAELHDIGKIAIPDVILNKPLPLTPEEWAFMRRHTIIGERILMAAPALRPVASLVRSSHERWDGNGYPDGLAGEAIPLGARVVAVCDAFDAMITDRSYRPAVTADEAREELRRCAGAQFDPRVVDAFCRATVLDAEGSPTPV